VEPGDVITHINGKSLHSLERAGVMSTQLDKGTKLTVIKADGGRLQVEI
jgi:C-terminal processing protease CtpA/Prc